MFDRRETPTRFWLAITVLAAVSVGAITAGATLHLNADAAADGFSARRLDWRYLTEQIPFEIRGELVR